MGHPALYERIIGGTTDRLVRLAPCTVLVVKRSHFGGGALQKSLTNRRQGHSPLRGWVARPEVLLLLALLLLAGEVVGLAAQLNGNLDGFVIAALAQGAVWVGAAVVVVRGASGRSAFALILATAILLRIGALAAPIFLSDDIYRYIWDGRVQAAGINPYRYVPTDAHLASLRDAAIFPNVNRNNYAPTIYPPVAQMFFFLATRFGESVLVMKLALVAIEAVGIYGLLQVLRGIGAPRENILFYAWHPLPVWEIAGSGHVDAVMVAFVALALAAAVRCQRAWSGAALAAATLVKFLPFALVPALWRPTRSNRGDWRWLAAFTAVIIAAYMPYIGVGSRVLGFLAGYVAEEKLASGSGFWIVEVLRRAVPLPTALYFALALAILAGLAIAALRRPPGPSPSLRWAMVLGVATTLLASPHYPWYFVWLVALLGVAPWWPAWWPTLAAVLIHLEPKTGQIPLWMGYTVYGGFAILACTDVAWRVLRARGPGKEPNGSPRAG
jgi:alpha-1,6-mannosyltransferase